MKIDYSKYADKIKFWKKTIESTKSFVGSSPPSVFVGRAFYPRVFVGILSPPSHVDAASVLDSPETWYKKGADIAEILSYRGQMIYSRFKSSSVKHPSGKLEDVVKEIAMAKRPTDVEIELKKNPKFKFMLDNWIIPVGNPAPIVHARLTENPSVERNVDYLISDIDFKATQAANRLYQLGIQVSRIQKIFSAGLLGLKMQRKFVPTRWSITAVDDIIGKNLREKVKDFQELGNIRLFNNDYLGNHYEILLIPGKYEFELIESWNNFGMTGIGGDYEPYEGRKTYADSTHGAFYAGRLAVLEYLERIKRQASILIVREILPTYDVPVGIWQLREAVRGAFDKLYETFATVDLALNRISGRLQIKNKWIPKSILLKELKEQTKLKQFLKVF